MCYIAMEEGAWLHQGHQDNSEHDIGGVMLQLEQNETDAASLRLLYAFPDWDMTSGARVAAYNIARPDEEDELTEWRTKTAEEKERTRKEQQDEEDRDMADAMPKQKRAAFLKMIAERKKLEKPIDVDDEEQPSQPVQPPVRTAPKPSDLPSAVATSATKRPSRRTANDPTATVLASQTSSETEPLAIRRLIVKLPLGKANLQAFLLRAAIKDGAEDDADAGATDEAAPSSNVGPSRKRKADTPEAEGAPATTRRRGRFNDFVPYPDTASDSDIFAGDPERFYYSALFQVLKKNTNSQAAEKFNKAHGGEKLITSQKIGERKEGMFKWVANNSHRTVQEVKDEFRTARETNGIKDLTDKGNRKGKGNGKSQEQ